jgi:DNA topoisomerase-3
VILVLAEKPSVARDLAAVIGAQSRHNGYLEGNGYRVTWAIGHLVGLAQPDQIEPAWKVWSRAKLPMLPSEFPLVVLDGTEDQYRIVERLLRDRTTTDVIAATDAGREGELIFRLIHEKSGCTKPWRRLWLSSMTPDAIRKAFAQLEPGSRYDGLGAAARARSQADWLVGMNLSRAYTLTHGQLFSVGRVQTPTLAMLVTRDREIERFVPAPYVEVEATFASACGTYRGTFYEPPPEGPLDERGNLRAFQPLRARLAADDAQANAIAARARVGTAKVAYMDQTTRSTPAPLLPDLTALQKEANRLYGLSAQATLDAAQELYERHKAISYPRTDSRYLSQTVAQTLPRIVEAIAPIYPGLVAANSGSMPTNRFVNDTKVTDHHAIIPTTQRPPELPAGSPAAQIYDLVCRHLLMIWHPAQVEAVTRLVTTVHSSENVADLYATQGTSIEVPGWTTLEIRSKSSDKKLEATASKIPGGLSKGAEQQVGDVVVHRKATRPPHAHTEATLLSAMEFAGRSVPVEDESLHEAMREFGLGTPATRAPTIETLIKRGYVVRSGKALTSTPIGQALIDAVADLVKSPEMTGRWEQRLRAMEQGGETVVDFVADIESYVTEIVSSEAAKPAAPRQPASPSAGRKPSRRSRGKLRYKLSPTSKAAGP